mmetsp:Transcript_49243/g.125051  ORF Transcript_49243/g.125051 Transcript_49243/m.125051 type:complete len:528 (-) Transcript_49243:127-1710(-)
MLRGKRVLITGASRGPGAQIAEEYAKEGAHLVLTGRSSEDLYAVSSRCHAALGACIEPHQVLRADLSTAEGVINLVNDVVAMGKPIDVLVNCAHSFCTDNAPLAIQGFDDLDRMLYVNLGAPMRLDRMLAPHMSVQKMGTIIHVGTSAACDALPGECSSYVASQHGLKGWSTSIYNSLREDTIKVVFVNRSLSGHAREVAIAALVAAAAAAAAEPEAVLPVDVAEVALLPFRVCDSCVPTEFTLRQLPVHPSMPLFFPVLNGKRVLVTGAGRGIGAAIARSYAEQGCQLILCARTREELESVAVRCEQVAGACMTMVQVVTIDLTTPAGVDELVNHVQQLGGVDVLVNNAGMMAPGNAVEGDPDEIERMLYLNLHAAIQLTRRLVPSMAQNRYGGIINIGSVAAVEPGLGTSAAYAATKHAFRGWSNCLFHSLRCHNVKVLLVNPDYVNTRMVNQTEGLIPHRMIQPSDIAQVSLMPFQLSSGCVPAEVTLRLTLRATTENLAQRSGQSHSEASAQAAFSRAVTTGF